MRKYILIFAAFLSALLLLCGCSHAASNSQNSQVSGIEEEKIVYPKKDGKKVVCLDAGHGYRDIGCSSPLLVGTEAEVNMAIVTLLKEELESRGVTVILTHDGTTYPSAAKIKELADASGVRYEEEEIIENDIYSANERAVYVSAVAEKEGIDLFLSLHVNSIENNTSISQYEIDYYKGNPYARALRVFAESLSDKLDNKTVIYEDEYDQAFIVTKEGVHPSCLIEMGYATNASDCEKLNSEAWRKGFVTTLADCVIEWIENFE